MLILGGWAFSFLYLFPTRFRIERINEKYDGIMNTLNSDEFRQSPNCGCLSSHVTIAATGDIKYAQWIPESIQVINACILRGIVAGKEKAEKCKWIKNVPFV